MALNFKAVSLHYKCILKHYIKTFIKGKVVVTF